MIRESTQEMTTQSLVRTDRAKGGSSGVLTFLDGWAVVHGNELSGSQSLSLLGLRQDREGHFWEGKVDSGDPLPQHGLLACLWLLHLISLLILVALI